MATSRSISRPAAAAFVVGAGAGLLWVAARRYGRDRADQILDWDQISAIALRACGTVQLAGAERAATDAEYSEIVRAIAEPLASYTGTQLDLTGSEVRALDRREWVLANVANFRELLRPFEDLFRDVAPAAIDLPGVTALGRLLLSMEVGVLLGYLARRVLGQYDISLLGAATDPGKLYFVEPNVQAVQLQLGLPRREFRTWLALHEATHVHQFEGNSWVREYLKVTLHHYLTSVADHLREDASADGLPTRLSRALERLSLGGTFLDILMTPYQRELVSRIQALMCLLEGYSNHVMNAVGRELLPHFEEIERRVEAKARRKSRGELLFLRLTGLKMKLDQYRLGAAFVNQVKETRGIEFMNQVWEGPEKLPTEQEIREPQRWVHRMDGARAHAPE